MNRWVGKTAVVTGAGGGIGGAIVNRLVQEGIKVVGLDFNWTEDTSSENKVKLKCDITNLCELENSFKLVEECYGGVDVMVNCAGMSTMGQITTIGPNPTSDEHIHRSFDVNIKAMIFCARFAVDSMKKRGVDGHIVNINSIAGHYVPFTDTFNVYSSSKYAVTAFTQSLLYELSKHKSKIKTTSISPGLVKTPLAAEFSDGKPGLQPGDVVDAVVYALSTPPHVNAQQEEHENAKFWKLDGTVNQRHDWFYQVQGQLHITNREYCLFTVWTGKDIKMKIIKILKDDTFWKDQMEQKLINFYNQCLLPEIVDPRKSRSMPIRDNPY